MSYPASARLLAAALPAPHYHDTYRLPVATALPASEAARLLFGPDSAPCWVRCLLALRNTLASWVGLKSTLRPGPMPDQLEAGGQLGPFRIFAVQPTEVLLGLDDRHLNFRVAVLTAEPHTVDLTTAVHFHNWVGRVYFAGITPFHRAVVRALLRRAEPRFMAPYASHAVS
ncbi:DUF2867 domain-containing protein [Hymenobacter perfusus]|nr:DUF2867 domain-containing protein [Hymenobacter perfusus]